jgi:hypothetical protein
MESEEWVFRLQKVNNVKEKSSGFGEKKLSQVLIFPDFSPIEFFFFMRHLVPGRKTIYFRWYQFDILVEAQGH